MDSKINLVIFNMSAYSDWQSGIENRNFQMLNNLLNHKDVGKVVGIDYLPLTLKQVLKNYYYNHLHSPLPDKPRFKSLKHVITEASPKLSVLNYYTQPDANFWQLLNQHLEKLDINDNYYVVSYYPLNVDYFKFLKPKKFIFEAVDDWSKHSSYSKFTNLLDKNYQTIDTQADIITTVSKDLTNKFFHKAKVHFLPNGVDVLHYQKKYKIINRDIATVTKPIIGYVGTIQDRFDVDLLKYLAINHPKYNFVLVGPIWYDQIRKELKKLTNVIILGRKKYAEIPMYIQQFDVAIVPHKTDAFNLSTNPMKIYGYLACGKPVITTLEPGFEYSDDNLVYTTDYATFSQKLDVCLAANDKFKIQSRLNLVKNHSWQNRVYTLIDLIKS